jgi:hypothetical protein
MTVTAPKSGRTDNWIKVKNPAGPAVKREAEENWGKKNERRPGSELTRTEFLAADI